MYEARNKPEELAKRVGKMTENMVSFNEETGEFDFPPEARMQLQAVSKELGIGMDSLTEMTRQASKIKSIKMNVSGNVLDENLREGIAGMARMKDGKWVVDFEQGGKTMTESIDKFTSEQAKLILDQEKEFADKTEKDFLKALGISARLLQTMTSKWKGKTPMLQNESSGKKKLAMGSWSVLADKDRAYKYDLAMFGGQHEVHIDVGATAVCDYYLTKKCSYINIGTHGLFTLNGKDVLGLNKKLKELKHPIVPDFANNASCKIRVRVQVKSTSKKDYQFVMTLQFSNVTKSPYNIAPLKPGSKSDIDLTKLKVDPILMAFT
jgi:hypothetical protein